MFKLIDKFPTPSKFASCYKVAVNNFVSLNSSFAFLMGKPLYLMILIFSLVTPKISSVPSKTLMPELRTGGYQWINSNDQIHKLIRFRVTNSRQKLLETKKKYQEIGFGKKIWYALKGKIWTVPVRRIL